MKSLLEYNEWILLLESYEVFENADGDRILVPRFKPKNTDHPIFKQYPVGQDFGYDIRLIYSAIEWGMILKIVYDNKGKKTERIIQPMVLGRNSKSDDLLRAFHLSGDSLSLGKDTNKVWRLFTPENIIEMSFTGSFFRTAEKNYKAEDSAMKGGILAAANFNEIRDKQKELTK